MKPEILARLQAETRAKWANRKLFKKSGGPNVTGVYIVGNTEHNWYKVGQAKTLGNRLRRLALPFPLDFVWAKPCDKPQLVESTLHKMFRAHHINREWYKLTKSQLKDVIEQAEILSSSPKTGFDIENKL